MYNSPGNAASAGDDLLSWLGILTFGIHAEPSNTECHIAY
jgi:hypothetical protein